MCTKYTAILDGEPVVLRACAISNSKVDGACSQNSRLQINGKTTHHVVGCFCSTDKCNDASSLQFTSISLFAFAIHVMYKLVSIE